MPDALPDILSPKIDFVFKQLFGDARHTAPLAAFLQAALGLPPEEFVGLKIDDPNLNRKFKGDKKYALDVRISTRSGRDVDVEIQVRPSDELLDRLQCYVARMVTEKVREGEDYKDMPQSISIVITDYPLWKRGAKRYHHRFRLYDCEAKLPYPNSMEIHTLELPKIPKTSDGTELWRWLKFISAKTRDEFASLAREDSVMDAALLKLMDLSNDKATRRAAEARAKWLWDDHGVRRKALREGGEQKQAEIAGRMVRAKMPLSEIAEFTGLSIKEIKRLAAAEQP